MQYWRLRGWIAVAVVSSAVGLLAACSVSRQHSEGLQAMAAGDREKGLSDLAAASAAEPTNSQYRLDYLKQLSLTVNRLLAQGDDARRNGQFDAARQLYRDTLKIDAGNDRAHRGLSTIEMDERHNAMLAEAEKLLAAHDLAGAREKVHTVLQENGERSDAKRLDTRIADEMDKAEAAKKEQIAANSVMKKPVSLQFRDANLRMVFEALSRTTGLNVIFDRDVRNDLKTTIFVHDASVQDTVDMILLQSQLDKKELNANTLFIYPATAAKQKEYQDLRVRVFQLSNADGKTVQNVLKSVLKVADMSLDDKTNTLVVRGTPDMIAVAEKIVSAHDYPDPEVMLEVEVLEVSRDRVRDLGIAWPSAFSLTTPNGVNTLHDLGHIPLNQLLVGGGPFGASANFSLSDSDANVLAAPRLRTRDNQKAKILIGEKVPVITNTVTPVATGSPVVTGSVQYLDVGIKLEVKPHVYLEGDVGIELNMEVSSILGVVNPPAGSSNGGTVAYDIGTRDVTTNLRLRDGETQILGGLIQDNETLSANKVPGLGEFPILDRLFGSNHHEDKKTEVVLSITPHILRAPTVADSRARNVFTGTESSVREMPLRLDPVGSVSGAPSTPGAAPTPGFVGGGGAGSNSALPPGAPANLPSVNPNYPRNDPRVPMPRHEVPPGVTPPPWLVNPPGGETAPETPAPPPPVEVQPPSPYTNPVPTPTPGSPN
ncbi:MAG TPA: secretin N-terminal domain-containing protein [Burkholderiaceae bacterium]|jgi:general secretion pathway protein D|nr:secretin N-terminal domain-containing protein [Burkholderiaceae bacterium]